MLKEKVLHCDETYVKVLKEQEVSENSKQYMWVYRTGKHSSKQIVIYDYNKSRSGDVPKAFLKDYDGYLHTDGYSGYNKLNKVTHCNCWAHLRCKFHEAIIVDSEDSIAKTARDFCDKLFAIESELNNLTTEERFNKRLTQERPVFEAFWSWAEKITPTVLPKTQRKMQSDHLLQAERTGCSVTLRTEQKPVLIYTASLRPQKRTGLMCSSILS